MKCKTRASLRVSGRLSWRRAAEQGASSMTVLLAMVGLMAALSNSPGATTTATGDDVQFETERRPQWQRMLTGEDSLRVVDLEERITELRHAGSYAEAIPLAAEVLEIRRTVQGADHWETADAQRVGQTLKHIASLPPEARAELARADGAEVEVDRLYEEGRYDEALSVFQQQLETRRRLLGEEHPDVALGSNDLGLFLHHKGDFSRAELLYREALRVGRRLLGPEHPYVATTLYNRAVLLQDKADYAGAEQLHREALAMHRKLRGDQHSDVARSLNYLALMLRDKGDYAQAEELLREALAIWRALYGDMNAGIAEGLNSLAAVLQSKGEYARAEVVARRALAVRRAVLGDEHPAVGESVNDLAVLLRVKGDYAQAEVLVQEALAIRRAVYGEEHPLVAGALSSLGFLLERKGDYDGAERLHRENLAMTQKLVGADYPGVASIMSHVGVVLEKKGDYAGAERLLREALALGRDLWANEHLAIAYLLDRLGAFLNNRGSYAEAEELYAKALTIHREFQGHEHPDVAACLNNLAALLWRRGSYAAAESVWTEAAGSFEAGRLRVSFGGLERIPLGTQQSPSASLAACLARNAKPLAAWGCLEASLSRGLLDAISSRQSRPLALDEKARANGLIGRLADLDERLSTLLAAESGTEDALAMTHELRKQRDALQAELAQFEADVAAKYGVAAGQLYSLERIQPHLSSDAALLAWVDFKGDSNAADPNGEHWACVVRHEGDPTWVKLPGGGEDGAWTEGDDRLPQRTRDAMSQPLHRPGGVGIGRLIERLHAQRVAPVEPYLAGVGHVVVLPAGWMAGVPVEVLSDTYTISYAPSATMYAWLREKVGTRERESADGLALLALGDPVFASAEAPDMAEVEPPEDGVVLASVEPRNNAARGGLRAGDVLLSYRGEMLAGPDELGPAIEGAAARGDSVVPVTVWREGETVELSVAAGRLGVCPSERPVPEAIALRRRLDRALETTRGRVFVPLPWTRAEVEGIAGLFDLDRTASTILLGPDASERRLDELASSGELGKYRYIHLASHAVMDDEVAMRSALILSQDPLDDSFERALEGLEVYDGRLTAEQIVRTWKINADLVTLSACETALGKESGGEGFLGFSQALFVAGAPSLVLTLWKVQDTPTMLLMRRFYENLLGRFDEPRFVAGSTYDPGSPIPKAEALREAKEWLRELTWEELRGVEEDLASAWRGEELPMDMPPGLVGGECPYEDPHYWAAFILMGNGD